MGNLYAGDPNEIGLAKNLGYHRPIFLFKSEWQSLPHILEHSCTSPFLRGEHTVCRPLSAASRSWRFPDPADPETTKLLSVAMSSVPPFQNP